MRIPSWLRRRPVDLDEDDFKDEIHAHLAIAANEKVSDGTDPRDARYAALKEFGNVTLTTEAARRVWTPRWLEALRDLTSDVRYAVRSLAKHKAFSLTVIGVLTLGIGLNAAVFTMLKAFALSPVAGVDDSSRLEVVFRETTSRRPLRMSYPDYVYLRDHDTAFTGLAGSIVARVGLGRDAHSRSLFSEIVTGNYFQALGVRAQLGRTLLPSDEVVPGGHPVVVISDGLWRRDFGADPGVVGTTIRFNNVPLTIVGVADAAFHGTIVSYDVEAFIPVMMAPELGFTFGSTRTTPSEILNDRIAGFFYPQGFLRPGVSRAAAAAQGDTLWATLALERPRPTRGSCARALSQTPDSGQAFFLPTLIVLGAMGLLVWRSPAEHRRPGPGARRVAPRRNRRAPGARRLARADRASAGRRERRRRAAGRRVRHPARGERDSGARALHRVAHDAAARVHQPGRRQPGHRLRGVRRLRLRARLRVRPGAPGLARRPGVGHQSGRVAARRGARASAHGPGRRAGRGLAPAAGRRRLATRASMRCGGESRFDPAHVTSIQLDLKQNGYDQARGRLFYRRLLDAVRADSGMESASITAYTR